MGGEANLSPFWLIVSFLFIVKTTWFFTTSKHRVTLRLCPPPSYIPHRQHDYSRVTLRRLFSGIHWNCRTIVFLYLWYIWFFGRSGPKTPGTCGPWRPPQNTGRCLPQRSFSGRSHSVSWCVNPQGMILLLCGMAFISGMLLPPIIATNQHFPFFFFCNAILLSISLVY